MKFIDEIRSAWRLLSVNIPAILAALAVIEANWGLISMFIPKSFLPWGVAIFAVAGILGRLIKQPEAVLSGVKAKIKALINSAEGVGTVEDYYSNLKAGRVAPEELAMASTVSVELARLKEKEKTLTAEVYKSPLE